MIAEPLSLTASNITVLQITQSVLSVCYNYNAALKGSSGELTKIRNELEGSRKVIQAIEPLMREAAVFQCCGIFASCTQRPRYEISRYSPRFRKDNFFLHRYLLKS